EREKGQFKHVVEKLDYIKELGINCIELLPVKEFPGKGWGYSLRSLFAVENSYGSPEDLGRLVDEAHARGIRVLIDGVYNHSEADAPLAKIAYEYWYYHPNPDPDYLQWGPKFNYTHHDKNLGLFPARKYVKESISFWVEKFHIDGIRFDATVAIRDFAIIRELADAAYDKVNGAKPFFTVAEHLPEDPAITQRANGAPVDAAWHDSLARVLQANILGREVDGSHPYDLDVLAAKLNPATNGYGDGGRYVNFITNHDFHRIMHMLGNNAKTFGEAAFRRVKLGLGLLLSAPGIPMLWMGQEFGFSSEKSLDPRPLDWTLLRHDNNKALRKYCQTLIGARKEHIALRKDTFECLLSDKERLLFAYKRWDEGGNVAVIAANLRDQPAGECEINSGGLEDGTWREIVNGYDATVSGGVLKDSLAESEVKVFIRQP
ncbi:MAG TPA: alpha-amylase family glycosyl hydrolase, partial [Tepidisphaeraceae bacterium]|nr:alpha-amylase family glycosyl hydrolase [Tepidisphaeraceae bacterium]